ncbi:MAG: transglutaminase family protein [Syntrophobacteraceae bacterium]|nr:transglutaminase family protein [Syntrophobacteraceae bacterium]
MRTRLLPAIFLIFLLASTTACRAKSGTITYDIELNAAKGAKQARLWLPYPLSDNHQTISDIHVSGNYNSSAVYREPAGGATYLYAQWTDISGPPSMVMSFHAVSKDRGIQNLKDSEKPVPETLKKYLASSRWAPANDYRKLAAQIVEGKTSYLARVHAVYTWVIEHTFRDNGVKGCGLGLTARTLTELKGGGKCADISSVFVTMARAAGIPARDVFGLRLADPKSGDISTAFHCWTQFYLPGTGWVMADPADVRKMMLDRNIKLKDAGKWEKFFWGGDDLFRVALEKNARGVVFNPPQKGEPLGYFMYPFAQVDGKSLDYFSPKDFRYTVAFKAD